MDHDVVGLWTRAAETYETEVPYFRLMGERIVELAALQPGESVLDVACGKGATLLPAARAVGPSGQVTGIDIVPAMVEAARSAAVAAGITNVRVEVMDGETLEFAENSFDAAICAFGLGFMRPDVALVEIARVLRHPGRLIASAPAGGGPDWAFFGELCARYGLESSAHPGGTNLPAPADMPRMFASVGFTLDPPVFDSVTVLFPDAEAWWRWVWSHGQRAFLEHLPADRVGAFREDANVALASFTTPQGIPLEQQFVVLTAHRAG